MVASTVQNRITGRSKGTVILRNRTTLPAPSTLAAS